MEITAYDCENQALYDPEAAWKKQVALLLATLMGLEYVRCGVPLQRKLRAAAKQILTNARGDLSTASEVLRDFQKDAKERKIAETCRNVYVIANRVNTEVSRRHTLAADRTDPGRKYLSYLDD